MGLCIDSLLILFGLVTVFIFNVSLSRLILTLTDLLFSWLSSDSVAQWVDAPAVEDCGIASVLHGIRNLLIGHSLCSLRHVPQ